MIINVEKQGRIHKDELIDNDRQNRHIYIQNLLQNSRKQINIQKTDRKFAI